MADRHPLGRRGNGWREAENTRPDLAFDRWMILKALHKASGGSVWGWSAWVPGPQDGTRRCAQRRRRSGGWGGAPGLGAGEEAAFSAALNHSGA
jgi:hypothetical protein